MIHSTAAHAPQKGRNTMTTKEQERKALEQIKKIVAGLGEGSYVATALDGMFEDAEENIENDFALSWKDRAQTAEKRLAELQADYNRQISEMSARRVEAENEVHEREERLIAACTERDENAIDAKEWHERHDRESEARAKAEATVAAQETEIIRLKAKLYDMMTK